MKITELELETIEDLPEALRTLKVPRMAEAFEEDQNDPESETLSFGERFLRIVKKEVNARQDKKIKHGIISAHLKMPGADFSDFDKSVQRELSMDVLDRLKKCEWINQKMNLIITGPCGTGKTWIGSALGVIACENYMSVRYYPTNRLLMTLKTYSQIEYLDALNGMDKYDLLILDDVGLQSYDLESCRIFFEILESRYLNGSVMFISQFPVSKWHDLFEDKSYANGILSRMIEHSYRLPISGEDIRTKGSHRNGDL